LSLGKKLVAVLDHLMRPANKVELMLLEEYLDNFRAENI
jgi:hypothetical protein